VTQVHPTTISDPAARCVSLSEVIAGTPRAIQFAPRDGTDHVRDCALRMVLFGFKYNGLPPTIVPVDDRIQEYRRALTASAPSFLLARRFIASQGWTKATTKRAPATWDCSANTSLISRRYWPIPNYLSSENRELGNQRQDEQSSSISMSTDTHRYPGGRVTQELHRTPSQPPAAEHPRYRPRHAGTASHLSSRRGRRGASTAPPNTAHRHPSACDRRRHRENHFHSPAGILRAASRSVPRRPERVPSTGLRQQRYPGLRNPTRSRCGRVSDSRTERRLRGGNTQSLGARCGAQAVPWPRQPQSPAIRERPLRR
jgi:hypothetical protein